MPNNKELIKQLEEWWETKCKPAGEAVIDAKEVGYLIEILKIADSYSTMWTTLLARLREKNYQEEDSGRFRFDDALEIAEQIEKVFGIGELLGE